MRVLRALVRLLPSGFRREYGEELLETVRARWVDRRGELTAGGRVRFWLRQWWALIRVAVALRAVGTGGSPPRLAGVSQRESGSQARREDVLDGLWGDVRQSARGLASRPGFTVVAVLTLGLGIGATTAMFSAVNSVLLRPLPYADADRVVALHQLDTRDGERESGVSAANIRDVVAGSETLAAAGVADPWSHDMIRDGRAVSLRSWMVSEGFFEAIGARPLLGRLFTPDEYQPNAERVVLLSHATWQGRFGGDPGVVGSAVRLNDAEHTVVGVLPPRFKYPNEAALWAPRPHQPWDARSRGAAYMAGVGRLAPGVTLEQAQAEMDRVSVALAEAYPRTNEGVTVKLTPLRDHLLGDVRTPLYVLFGAVALVLLIAAANVAGLQLARGAGRRREYALRGALGASGGRLLRLVLVESLLIAGTGCLVGLALAYGGVHGVRLLGPDHLPRIEELAIELPVLLFAIAATAAAAVGSGIAPALGAARVDPQGALADGGRSATPGRRAGRLRDRLVVGEIALALVLSIGAGLLVRSFVEMLDRDLGYETERRLAVQVFAYDNQGQPKEGFLDRTLETIAALPGVEGVAVTTDLPSADDQSVSSIDIVIPFTVDNRVAPEAGPEPRTSIAAISRDYPEVMGIEVVQGRSFTTADHATSPPMILVNEAFAGRHFPDTDPVGERITMNYYGTVSREIVGVLADVRARGHESEPRPEAYLSIAQVPSASLTFVVETAGDPASLVRPVQEAIWEVDPSQAVWAARTLPDLLWEWARQRTFNTAVLTAFALLALLLSAIGVYGLMSFTVAQRVSEVGIRRAMGAETGHIFRAVLGRGAILAGTGIGIGLVASLAGSRLIRGMLFSVTPVDPVVFIGLAGVVMLVAVLAAFLPAWRAARVDPSVALRAE